MSKWVKTYKFNYSGECIKAPVFSKEDLYIATENDRNDLENINFFEEGEIDIFLENSSIYILRINGEYVGLGTILIPTWRKDISDEKIRDLGMHVAEKYRCHGYGRSMVQNLAEICLEKGLTPIAECLSENEASRITLLSAGFVITSCDEYQLD